MYISTARSSSANKISNENGPLYTYCDLHGNILMHYLKNKNKSLAVIKSMLNFKQSTMKHSPDHPHHIPHSMNPHAFLQDFAGLRGNRSLVRNICVFL